MKADIPSRVPDKEIEGLRQQQQQENMQQMKESSRKCQKLTHVIATF